jgi:hypothetical protein
VRNLAWRIATRIARVLETSGVSRRDFALPPASERRFVPAQKV